MLAASNGDPKEVTSLHNVTTPVPNQYEQAIRAVGDIIRDYDTDKMFPVLGFGARLPPDGRISHEFFVNLDQTNPYVADINGVLAAYKSCVHRVQLYGPTNFAPVIHHVSQFARQYADGSQYFILLIITDGVITDMPQTKEVSRRRSIGEVTAVYNLDLIKGTSQLPIIKNILISYADHASEQTIRILSA